MTHFEDFSFKLLVVDRLMYQDEVLTPGFDWLVHLTARGVEDPHDYSYLDENFAQILPECREYFQNLVIPTELLHGVTSILADGGNEAFMHAAPTWDGEDDLFDVRSLADLDLVPNLREISAEPHWFPPGADEVFAARGISRV